MACAPLRLSFDKLRTNGAEVLKGEREKDSTPTENPGELFFFCLLPIAFFFLTAPCNIQVLAEQDPFS